jgi:indole-3-glycerol phosphate synthase
VAKALSILEDLMSLIEEILKEKRAWVSVTPKSQMRPNGMEIRNTLVALHRPFGKPLRLIAENKFQSPSGGQLSKAMSAGQRALCYERAGASMVSVLTDKKFFGGSFFDLSHSHNAVRIPVLCKDFIVDELQIAEAHGHGADAVLLIARCLPGRDLRRLATAVRKRGMTPFFEITTEEDLQRVMDVNPQIIGVNARDLDTLEMDTERAARVLAKIPGGVVAVHLSGLKTPEDVIRIARTRADAALIGESLMRQPDPTKLLQSLVTASRG